MNNKIYLSLFLFAIIVIFNSCDDEALYSGNNEITSDAWGIGDSAVFKAKISETESFYNVFIDIKINELFLTNNLWLYIFTESPSGNIQSDTIMYFITDERGKWLGKEKGAFIENKFMYKAYIKFPEKGEYTFIIKHGMREKDLPLIESIGITVELAKITENENL